MYDSCLTRTDRHLIASVARYIRPGGWLDGLQSNSLLPRRFRSSGALRTPCGAGRLAHEPCGHQSDACSKACWTGIQTVPISDSAITDAETKRKAIENAYQPLTPDVLPDWTSDTALIGWLDSLGR